MQILGIWRKIKNDKTIKKYREKTNNTNINLFNINNSAGMVRAKNARLYVRNNNISENTRK